LGVQFESSITYTFVPNIWDFRRTIIDPKMLHFGILLYSLPCILLQNLCKCAWIFKHFPNMIPFSCLSLKVTRLRLWHVVSSPISTLLFNSTLHTLPCLLIKLLVIVTNIPLDENMVKYIQKVM
jgi:hypothetical protein